jgi:hypothetical protein
MENHVSRLLLSRHVFSAPLVAGLLARLAYELWQAKTA